MNIYIPPKLQEYMQTQPGTNWSDIAQRAFVQHLTSGRPTTKMSSLQAAAYKLYLHHCAKK